MIHNIGKQIAEYIVGLFFAAHKNPSIASTQAYLLLWERATLEDQVACKK